MRENQDIVDLLVSELGKMSNEAEIIRKNKRKIIIDAINKYLKLFADKEKELLRLLTLRAQEENKKQFNTKEEIINNLTNASKDLRELVREKQELQYYSDLKQLFITGYRLIMVLREYFTNDTIKYEVASEIGDYTFEIDEKDLLNQSRAAISSLNIILREGQLHIDYVQKVVIGSTLLKKAKEKGKNINENLSIQKETGTTFWSRGIRILHALQGMPEISGGRQGLNFGHFFETYTYYNGNDINFLAEKQPKNLEYAAAMLALRNSKQFYKGGDVNNKQLKANEATIGHISTIKRQLENILQILESEDKVKEKTLKIRQSFKDSGAERGIQQLIENKKKELIEYLKDKQIQENLNKFNLTF